MHIKNIPRIPRVHVYSCFHIGSERNGLVKFHQKLLIEGLLGCFREDTLVKDWQVLCVTCKRIVNRFHTA